MSNQLVFLDFEVYSNYTLALFLDGDEFKAFELYDDFNNLIEIKDYVESKYGVVTFNGLHYDSVVLQHIINNNGNVTNEEIKKLSDEIINSDKPLMYESSFSFKTLDLMKIHHLDRFGKGLKDCAVYLKHDRLQDLPYPPDTELTEQQRLEVKEYCKNDVIITKKLFDYSKDAIGLRKDIRNKYGINSTNLPDAQLGENLVLKFVSKEMGIPSSNLRKMGTKRGEIHLEECISDLIKFKSPILNKMKDDLSSRRVSTVKGAVEYKFLYDGQEFKYGLGGLHSFVGTPTVFKSTDKVKVVDVDVTSYYPNISTHLGIAPKHLGEYFLDVYKWMFEERTKYPKGSSENYAMKISLNGCFGKFNSEYSFLYDPKALLSITLNGQMLLTMLIERLSEAGIKTVMGNTDGITCIVPVELEQVHKDICERWEKYTGLNLEHSSYDKLFARDINNYIAVLENGKIKRKGAYDYEKGLTKKLSTPVVAKAAEQFLLNSVSINDFIRDHDDIYDFCDTFKTNKGWATYLVNFEGEEPCQKTNRYFYSKVPGSLIKRNTDGRVSVLAKNRNLELFNDYREGPYRLDYNYYIKEAMKLTDVFAQSTLF